MNTSVDNEFSQATEALIALYRKTERKSLDLPVLSIKPLFVFFWAFLKFFFFFYVGIVLIIPVNLVIMVRNFFPGNWRYRPFFLSYLHYVWMWVWRGEVPSGRRLTEESTGGFPWAGAYARLRHAHRHFHHPNPFRPTAS
jgi:hypothetical protein